MNTTNTLDIPSQLTEAELQQLWAPVPEDRQQREEMVRISLGPELETDYTGPVELSDLRLALSPWLWSKAELASSPRTQTLNQALTEIRARNPDMELDTMPSVVQWLIKKLDNTPEDWALFPDHSDFWEDCGVTSLMIETGQGTFVPMDLELSAVYFYTEPEGAASSRLVVAQSRFGTGRNSKWGPVAIYACSQRLSVKISGAMGWLNTSDSLVLKNVITGERAILTPGSENAADEDYDDEQGEQRGMQPAPTSIAAPLHYKAGRLYQTDTSEQALALELFLPSEHDAN